MKKTRKQNKDNFKEIKSWTLHLALAFTAVLFLTSEVFAITEVSGSSMENTLIEGEKLYLNKLSYNFSDPESGDVVVFLEGEVNNGITDRLTKVLEDVKMKIEKNPRRNRYIKRVIGVPGDEVNIIDGKVYVNNLLLDEKYIKGITDEISLKYPAIVPEGKLFVMGDNRQNSKDSRMFGFVDFRSIEGKVSHKIWPLGKVED